MSLKGNHTEQPSFSNVPLKRTRAKRSCDFCRKRKSRCDADTSVPCSNCRAWGYTCEFSTVRKKRGPPSVYVDNLEKRCKKMERLLTKLTNTTLSDLESNDFNLPSSRNSDSSQEEDEDDKEIESRLSALTVSDYDSATYTGRSASFNTLIDPQLFENKTLLPWPGRDNVALQLTPENELILVRPSKLDIGLSMRTSVEMKKNKKDKGKQRRQQQEPDQQVIDKMIAVYFSHIHEFMPVVNRDTFSLQTSPPILIHSMLAVSFQFAMLYLGEPRSEFAQFYLHKIMKRLRACYRSRLSYVQAALLLTLYLDMNDEEEDCESLQWYTLGTAIRMALDLGLHRSCAHWNIPASEVETRHRTFYACYFLDRWLSARAGKPLTLLDRYFDTPLPQLGYPAFTCMVRLAELIGRVLKAMYAPKSKNANANAGLDDFTILDVLYRRLKPLKSLWDDLPASHRVHLDLYYYIIVLLLHRPYIDHSLICAEECIQAATAIHDLVSQRQQAELMYSLCLPTCFVYALFQSSLVYFSCVLKDRSPMRLGALQRSVSLLKQHATTLFGAQRALDILVMLSTLHSIPLTAQQQQEQQAEHQPILFPEADTPQLTSIVAAPPPPHASLYGEQYWQDLVAVPPPPPPTDLFTGFPLTASPTPMHNTLDTEKTISPHHQHQHTPSTSSNSSSSSSTLISTPHWTEWDLYMTQQQQQHDCASRPFI